MDKDLKERIDWTKPSEEIKEITSKFPEESFEYAKSCVNWIHEGLKDVGFQEGIFRKRTAEEIVRSGEVTGCSDVALVFLSFLRVRNIEGKFVETVSDSSVQDLKRDINSNIRGHVFVEVEHDNKIYIIDPVNMEYMLEENFPQDSKRFPDAVVIGKGKDFEEIGTNSLQDIKDLAINNSLEK